MRFSWAFLCLVACGEMTELEDAELEVPARTLSECSGSYTEVIEAYGTSSWDSSPEECAQDAVDDCNANLADLMDAFVEDCEDFCGRQGCGYYIRGDDGSLCDWPPPSIRPSSTIRRVTTPMSHALRTATPCGACASVRNDPSSMARSRLTRRRWKTATGGSSGSMR